MIMTHGRIQEFAFGRATGVPSLHFPFPSLPSPLEVGAP